jgi:putative spermidine/putrescine transport system substrate-binding protein
LTFASYGGSTGEGEQKAWVDPYEASTGAQITVDEGDDPAKLKAMVEANQVTWDVVDVDSDLGLDNQPWFEPIDYNVVDKGSITPEYAGKYRIGVNIFSIVLGYNTDKTKGQTPSSWADFFDLQKFPGKRGVKDYASGGILEMALLADGVSPDDLYPLDVDRALKKLDTIKDQLVYWGSGSEGQKLLESGEVTMGMVYNGRAWNAKNVDNAPVEIQWNQQLMNASYFVVPKGAPNKEAAMRWLAYIMSTPVNGQLTKYVPYGPTNPDSEVDEAMKDDLPNSHPGGVHSNDNYYADNFAAIDTKYQAWKSQS